MFYNDSFEDDFEDDLEEGLQHVGRSKLDGAPVGSGRYPLGSGENPNQHNSVSFNSIYDEYKKIASSEKELATMMGFSSTTKLRSAKTIATTIQNQQVLHLIRTMHDDEGMGWTEIGNKLGIPEGTVRDKYKNENSSKNATRLDKVSNILKGELDNGKKMIDVTSGVEKEFSLEGKPISADSLDAACKRLADEDGYQYFKIQIGGTTDPKKKTTFRILGQPDTNAKYAYQHLDEIDSIVEYKPKEVDTRKAAYPASLDSERVAIRYAEEGGLAKDGVIELRRGVKDLSLGNSNYAQVRILVDGTHYLKGMAMYSDDMPEGKDIIVNSNKPLGTDKYKVFKSIKTEDPDNPFGANIMPDGQSTYIDDDGKTKLSPINKLKEEADWDRMSKNLSSQFLSKQPIGTIKNQLNLTYADKNAQFDEIKSISNTALRKKYLLDFADQCETDAWQLKSSPMPGQSTKVILPLTKIKDDECYCPTYENGTKLALVRYPHAGTFEIPIVTVNNKNPNSKSILGNVQDAIGISSKAAEQLSGADFDGDQVVAIPLSSKVKVMSKPMLSDLDGFDTKTAYNTVKETRTNRKGETVEVYVNPKTGKECKILSEDFKQREMGSISNLITDMTLHGADLSDIAKADKYSMVVIDASKHKLDYKQAFIDCDIAKLKDTYQKRIENGKETSGAWTLLARRKQTIQVPERQGSGIIDPDTGKVSYRTSGRMRKNEKTGEWDIPATTEVKRLLYVDDAHELSSGTPEESAYADYSNKMRAMANAARKEAMATPTYKKDTEAAKIYASEVESLNTKLDNAIRNANRERKALVVAKSRAYAKTKAYTDATGIKMDKKEYKKLKQREMNQARIEFGSNGKRARIILTDREWEALQHHAIAATTATKIFTKCDDEKLKERALPKENTIVTEAKQSQIKAMLASGYTYAEVSEKLNISTSTIAKYK